MKATYKNIMEYLAVFAIWLLIFGKNSLSNLVFVDYIPSTFPDVIKALEMSGFVYRINLFDIFKSLLTTVNLGSIAFSISMLIAMIISYYFIKKIAGKYSLLFALIFFFNPFIYSRIMIGQIGIILSYLIMPIYSFYLLELFEKQFSNKTLIKTAISATFMGMFSLQFFVFAVIMFFIAVIFSYKKQNNYMKIISIFIILLLLLNLYWIQGFFSNTIFSSINSEHENFFAPKSTGEVSAVTKIIGMWGFWREVSYITPFTEIPIVIWFVMLAIFVLLALWGYYNDMDKFRANFFFSLWCLGILFATGISHPLIAPIFDFLFKNIPFFNGFRDSHKFLALTALAYAYFIPLGIKDLFDRLKEKDINSKIIRISVIIFTALFIITYTYPLICLSNQISPVDYPQAYFDANNYLDSQNTKGYIIYLPWQTYLTYSWTQDISSDGRIAVPINAIIKKPVLVGPDKWGSSDSLTDSITSCISKQSTSCLENAGVQYIIKDNCAQFVDKYSWISNPVYSNSCLEIYELNPQTIKQTNFSLRFIIALEISLLTLIVLIVWIFYQNGHSRKE
ncbi:MAG: hypothetical protein WC781_05305 [Candidatus Pacearchaeota archaeon]